MKAYTNSAMNILKTAKMKPDDCLPTLPSVSVPKKKAEAPLRIMPQISIAGCKIQILEIEASSSCLLKIGFQHFQKTSRRD